MNRYAATKWAVVRYGFKSSVNEVHVMPLRDKLMHTLPMCWCRPKAARRGLHVHRAVDGRP